ncbi:TPA: hypothetical protein OTX98_005165 [Klebsiella aerogenes]|nr:hypothetical protein [Klebsiella aerogenes]
MKHLILAALIASVSVGAVAADTHDGHWECHNSYGESISIDVQYGMMKINGDWAQQSQKMTSAYYNHLTRKNYSVGYPATYYGIVYDSENEILGAVDYTEGIIAANGSGQISGAWINSHIAACHNPQEAADRAARKAEEQLEKKEAIAAQAEQEREQKELDAALAAQKKEEASKSW